MTNKQNLRGEERVKVALPVKLGKASGLTRDVSASGICFEVDANYKLGSKISFVIEVQALGEKMLMKCKGSIVRAEARGKKSSVAVKITESTMEVAN